MVEAARRQQNTLHHMLARRILTAIVLPTELDTAATAPMDFRGTHTCKRPVDARILMSAPLKGHARIAASTRRAVSTVRAHQG